MPAIPVVSDGQTITAAHHDAIATEMNGPWTQWTPVLTATTSNPTLGTGGIAAGRYKQLASGLVVGAGQFSYGTSGTAGGTGFYESTLPVAAKAVTSPMTLGIVGTCALYDSSAGVAGLYVGVLRLVTDKIRFCTQGTGVTGATVTVPFAWNTSDSFYFQFSYEPA